MIRHFAIGLAAAALLAAPVSAKTHRSAAAVPAPARLPQLPPVPKVSAGYAAPVLTAPPARLVGITQQNFVGITLQNAIGMALSHNPGLALAQANRRIAQYQIEAAKGAYDVNFSIEPQYQYVTQPPTNAFFAGPNFGPIVQKSASLNAGLQGILPGGQSFSVSASGKRTDDNTTINSFNPYYPTIFSVSFAQPLSRGRRITPVTRALQLAQINAATTSDQTLTTVASTIAQVENTYWDLVAAWRNVAIQEQALKDTITQQHSNVRLARAGANAPIDVVQSNTQIAVFQENVYSALASVATLQNQLKSSLLSDPNDPIWNANLVPTTPALQLPQEPSLASLVLTALRNRPELAQIADERRAADVNLQYAADETKPQLDLQLGYTSNGYAGQPTNPANSAFLESSIAQVTAIDQLITAVNQTLPAASQIPALPNSNTPIPPYLQGGLERSIENLLSNKFPVYSAGLLMTFPIGNTTARANLAAANEQERILQLQEASAVEGITADVRDALQGYESSQARLIAAEAARSAAQQVLASEERRFHAGASTTFLVLQREVELANDRGLELQAQTDLNKAVVAIQRATGTILSVNNVDITKVGQGALQ